MSAETSVRELLEGIGVTIDGPEPSDIQVHDRRFFRKILVAGNADMGNEASGMARRCVMLPEH